MKFKNVEVGQRVVIKRSTNETWDRAKFHIGEEFEVILREGPDYPKDEATVLVRRCADASVEFWCSHRDLGRVKEKAPKQKAPKQKPTEAPKRDIKAELAAAWPWPEGTPVRFAVSGDYPQHADKEGCVLGDDGSRVPPVRSADGQFLCYVDANDVLLGTEYQTWGRHSSRKVSALTEEQRTGPLYKKGAGARIMHSRDGAGEPATYFYYAGDYRDNGDGTGTVLTLEEIFLNGLKK